MRDKKVSRCPLLKLRTSFQATGPQIFQLGDIVEVQVSFIAIPMRGKKWKISTILRRISLFEGRFTQVKNAVCYQVKKLTTTQDAFVRSLTLKAAPIQKVKPSLKKRVGYTEEEVSTTRAKLAEMEIDEEIDTGNEKGRDDNEKTGEAMQNVANC